MQTNANKITLDCRVDSYRAGWTVVEFLSHRFKYHPARRWTHRVKDGRVLVNGMRVPPDHAVGKGDLVSYTIFHNEPEVDFRYEIVHEDDDILAVAKPGNLPVHACGVYIRNTLVAHVKNRFGEHINLAHRLDRETSGVVLLSKNTAAARKLSMAFASGSVAKEYVAVVHGAPQRCAFEVDAPIGKTDDIVPLVGERETMRGVTSELKPDFPRYVPRRMIDYENGKPAKTAFRVLRYGSRFTVLEARPLSGRTNQIRVHLYHLGLPLVGDKVYRMPGEVRDTLELGRHALHCRSLEFDHPTTCRRLRLEAQLPEDLRVFHGESRRERSGNGEVNE